MNPLQDKWFPVHFLQQNVKKNLTRLILDGLFILILIRCFNVKHGGSLNN